MVLIFPTDRTHTRCVCSAIGGSGNVVTVGLIFLPSRQRTHGVASAIGAAGAATLFSEKFACVNTMPSLATEECVPMLEYSHLFDCFKHGIPPTEDAILENIHDVIDPIECWAPYDVIHALLATTYEHADMPQFAGLLQAVFAESPIERRMSETCVEFSPPAVQYRETPRLRMTHVREENHRPNAINRYRTSVKFELRFDADDCVATIELLDLQPTYTNTLEGLRQMLGHLSDSEWVHVTSERSFPELCTTLAACMLVRGPADGNGHYRVVDAAC